MNDKIFNTFIKLIKRELKISSPYKFSEELFRYLLYKSLLLNNYKDHEIKFEFSDNISKRIDLYISRNQISIEIKFHRELKDKGNNNSKRSILKNLGRVLSDLFKLGEWENGKKYFLYIIDDWFFKKLEKKLDFLLKEDSKEEIDKDIIINKYNNKKTINQYIERYNDKTINIKKIYYRSLKIDEKKYLKIYLYEIK